MLAFRAGIHQGLVLPMWLLPKCIPHCRGCSTNSVRLLQAQGVCSTERVVSQYGEPAQHKVSRCNTAVDRLYSKPKRVKGLEIEDRLAGIEVTTCNAVLQWRMSSSVLWVGTLDFVPGAVNPGIRREIAFQYLRTSGLKPSPMTLTHAPPETPFL